MSEQTNLTTVQTWAKRAAYAVPLCVLPSALWRVALVTGLVGHDNPHDWAPGERVYVLSLSVVSMALAMLTLGLVHQWGERWPSWLGGRPIPARVVTVAAWTGVGLLTLIWGYGLLNYLFHFVPPLNDTGETLPNTGREALILQLCYGPLLAWPPLLAVATVGYQRRRASTVASPRNGRAGRRSAQACTDTA